MLIRVALLAAVVVVVLLLLFGKMTAVPHKFEERWQASKTTGTAAIKAVPTIRIIPLPTAEIVQARLPPPQEPTIEPDLPPHRPQAAAKRLPRAERREERRARRGDICARHGLRKVVTGGGRSWRCRK